MCGITAFSGRYATNKALSMTLSQLNRGTQGAGVAYIDEAHTLQVRKIPGHPVKFAVLNHYFWGMRTYSAISHNRMPSKGEVKIENTHPFIDCKGRFAMIHNGTVIGLETTRAELLAAGHKIEGETDSEVVAHLICKYLDDGGDMMGAMHMLMKEHPCTILVLTAEGDIFGLKSSYPIWVCEFEADERNEASVAIASEHKAIETALPELEFRKHTLTELKTNDILHVRGGHLLQVDHHEPPKSDFEWNKAPPVSIAHNRPSFYLDDVKTENGTMYGYTKSGQRVNLGKRVKPFPDRRFDNYPRGR